MSYKWSEEDKSNKSSKTQSWTNHPVSPLGWDIVVSTLKKVEWFELRLGGGPQKEEGEWKFEQLEKHKW